MRECVSLSHVILQAHTHTHTRPITRGLPQNNGAVKVKGLAGVCSVSLSLPLTFKVSHHPRSLSVDAGS